VLVSDGGGPGQSPRGYRDITAAKEELMLGWSLTFFILALVAGLLGFAGLAGAAAGIAKILFYIFLILLVVSFLARAIRGQSPV
jgi:uncharacterized membrane protein YtjA (UPF0391 family)